MAENGQLKEFLADSKKLIGKEAPDVANGISVVDWTSIQKLSLIHI